MGLRCTRHAAHSQEEGVSMSDAVFDDAAFRRTYTEGNDSQTISTMPLSLYVTNLKGEADSEDAKAAALERKIAQDTADAVVECDRLRARASMLRARADDLQKA